MSVGTSSLVRSGCMHGRLADMVDAHLLLNPLDSWTVARRSGRAMVPALFIRRWRGSRCATHFSTKSLTELRSPKSPSQAVPRGDQVVPRGDQALFSTKSWTELRSPKSPSCPRLDGCQLSLHTNLGKLLLELRLGCCQLGLRPRCKNDVGSTQRQYPGRLSTNTGRWACHYSNLSSQVNSLGHSLGRDEIAGRCLTVRDETEEAETKPNRPTISQRDSDRRNAGDDTEPQHHFIQWIVCCGQANLAWGEHLAGPGSPASQNLRAAGCWFLS